MTFSSSSCFGAEWTTLSNSLPGGGRHALAYASSLSGVDIEEEEEDKQEDRHYVLGGYDADGRSCRTVWETNVSLQTFATQTPLPESRLSAAATAMDPHRFMIVGGITTSESCRVYDTRTQQWITNHHDNDNVCFWPNLNIGRYQHACCCVNTAAATNSNNNKIYTIGGYSHNYGPLDVIEELDLSLPIPSWRILPQRLQQKRSGCCVVVDPHNPHNLIVVGGFNKKDKTLATCEIVSLEPSPPPQEQEAPTAALLQQQQQQQPSTTTTRRRTLPSMTTPRANHTMVLVENRFLVVMGGNCYNHHKHRFHSNHKRHKNKKKNKRHLVLSSVEVLDLEQEPHRLQWRTLPSMKTPRSRFAAFYSPRNHKIVVVAGGGQPQDDNNNDDHTNDNDTVEELQVHYRRQRPRRRQPRRQEEKEEEGRSSSASLTPSTSHCYYHHSRRCFVPPPLKELAREDGNTTTTTTTKRIHQTKRLQHWLDETEQQMTDFVASVDAREKELLWERDENRRICNNHVAHVHAKQNEARLLLGTQPNHPGNRFLRRFRRRRGNHHHHHHPVQVNDNDNDDYFRDEELDDYNNDDNNDDNNGAGLVHSWGDLQKPPRLTQLSLGSGADGCLGWTRRRRHNHRNHHNRIGLWIVENERRKNAYAAAIDTHETQLMRELNENRRVCNDYVSRARALQEQTKRRLVLGNNNNTTTPHELLCPITQEVMVDPVLTVADGHTYERTAIERVLQEQDDPRSPVTGLLLTTKLLVPNVALRSLCRDYHPPHSSSSSSYTATTTTTTAQKGGSNMD